MQGLDCLRDIILKPIFNDGRTQQEQVTLQLVIDISHPLSPGRGKVTLSLGKTHQEIIDFMPFKKPDSNQKCSISLLGSLQKIILSLFDIWLLILLPGYAL